jgi:hypothetical protein
MMSSIEAPSRSHLWGIVTSPKMTSAEVTGTEVTGTEVTGNDGFSRVSQCSRNITHGFSGTSVYQIKYTVLSAYSGAFFLNSDGL